MLRKYIEYILLIAVVALFSINLFNFGRKIFGARAHASHKGVSFDESSLVKIFFVTRASEDIASKNFSNLREALAPEMRARLPEIRKGLANIPKQDCTDSSAESLIPVSRNTYIAVNICKLSTSHLEIRLNFSDNDGDFKVNGLEVNRYDYPFHERTHLQILNKGPIALVMLFGIVLYIFVFYRTAYTLIHDTKTYKLLWIVAMLLNVGLLRVATIGNSTSGSSLFQLPFFFTFYAEGNDQTPYFLCITLPIGMILFWVDRMRGHN
jgi:hypothetical protein